LFLKESKKNLKEKLKIKRKQKKGRKEITEF